MSTEKTHCCRPIGLPCPQESGWAWFSGAKAEREQAGDFKATSLELRAGRSRSEDHIDRNYYLQYDYARLREQTAVKHRSPPTTAGPGVILTIPLRRVQALAFPGKPVPAPP